MNTKHKHFRRSMSIVLAVTMATSCLATGLTAFAADSWPPKGEQARAKAQPHFSGYRMKDVRNWDSETDPFAEMMRAKVPVQERNSAFAATQANPDLATGAKTMLMQGDYGNSFFDSMMYNNSFSEHVLNFWQYTDYFSPWHGAATAFTPQSIYDPATSDWRNRGFEFGMLNIPNAAYTNAAHKNGALSIACLYFDQAFRPGQSINELLDKDEDGNFRLVDRLVDIANYYGFDGYFLNKEDYPDNIDDMHEFMRQMTAKGMYTQYYDTGSTFTDSKGNWIKNGNYNSIFINYGGLGQAKSAYDWGNNNGYSSFDIAFYGVEANKGKFSSSSYTSIEQTYMPGTKNPYASLALFTPSDYYQRGLDDDIGSDSYMPKMQQSKYQWMVAERERMWFSGVKQDPTNTGKQAGFSRNDIGVSNASGWVGLADCISERSVINGSTFYTNFNTGHGMQYFDNGVVSADDEWSNINIQDILPSWQWWMETEGTKLGVDFDYGSKEVRADRNGNNMTLPYTQVGGYKGGSSLAVYGDIDSENFLHLYKTDLQVKDNTKASITYNKVSADDTSKMELGVIFKSAPDTVITFNVPQAGKQTDGWVTKQISLGDYAGEEIAAMGLVFSDGKAGVQDYQMNIGEMKILDGENHTPDAPTGLKIQDAYDSKEMVLTWDLDSYDNVDKYNVYANLSDGSRVCLGGIYDSIYYIKNIYENEIVTVDVTAVGKDGSESAPASIAFDYRDKVSNIVVDEKSDKNAMFVTAANSGYLDVSFDKPNVAYKGLKLTLALVDSKDETTYTTTVGNDTNNARIYIPRGHGETYDLFISTIYNDDTVSAPVAYRGILKDVWSQTIDLEDVVISGNSVWFRNPASVDWYKIHGYVNGQEVINYKRGASSINSKKTLPGSSGVLQVVLEDFSGNMSAPVNVSYGSASSSGGAITDSNVPDAVLRQAILEQVGSTTAEAEAFTGTLDLTGLDIHNLTGLNMVSQAANIILSGTPIESIGEGVIGANVKKLDLSGCTDLKLIDENAFKGTVELREVDITGCSALQVLEIVDSSVEILTYGEADAFPNIIRLNLSGSRFDLSANTPERAFVDQIATQADPSKNIETTDPNESNLALGATIVADQTTLNNASRLFDGVYSYFGNYSATSTMVADLGEAQTITSWKLFNDTYPGYGLEDFNLYGSNDKTNYELIASVTGNKETRVGGAVAEPKAYRYIKLEALKNMSKGGDMQELELYGHKTIVYESEVIVDNQRPRILPADMKTTVVTQKKNGLVINLSDMLENAINEANSTSLTVRGNEAGTLEGADFIDPDYVLAPETSGATRDVHLVRVTDAAGNSYFAEDIDASKDGIYTVEYITYNSDNLEGEALYTFTLKVRAITSVLEEVIANAEQLVADGALENTMEAVVTEFNAALQAAKDLVAQDYASQEDVNAATIRLLAVMAKVDWKQGDKTNLEIAVEIANTIKPNLDLYVEAGKQEFLDALDVAEKLMASGNAWDDDIKAATTALIEAMQNLRMAANKDILNDMINKAQSYDLSNYTADSADAVRAALASAEALAADANATQDAVDAAANTLKAALSGLTLNNNNGDVNSPSDNNGTTTPVGDGSAPTKTGDAGVAGLTTLALLSAAGALLVLKRKRN